ncbi:MAG: permease-like cell division protein FtsX [Nitrospirota bacterium]
MKTIWHSLHTAFKTIWLEKSVHLLAVLSISIGLSIICAFTMITFNMDSALKRWSRSFGVVVYLNEQISKERETSLKNRFLQDPDISEVKYISKEQALQDVRKTLGKNALILDAFQINPLPSSFELKLKRTALDPLIITKKVKAIGLMSGVKEVQYGEKWLSSLSTIAKTMKIGAIVFGSAIFIAITFITYCIIKIFFSRRKDDIETLKLLGAPRLFIKLPFLIEGFFIGAVGGTISSLLLFGIYAFTSFKVAEFMPSINLFVTSLPLLAYLFIPCAGALMSLTGSYIAVGKIRY